MPPKNRNKQKAQQAATPVQDQEVTTPATTAEPGK